MHGRRTTRRQTCRAETFAASARRHSYPIQANSRAILFNVRFRAAAQGLADCRKGRDHSGKRSVPTTGRQRLFSAPDRAHAGTTMTDPLSTKNDIPSLGVLRRGGAGCGRYRERWGSCTGRGTGCALSRFRMASGDEHLDPLRPRQRFCRSQSEGGACRSGDRLKLYHFARFDLAAIMSAYLGDCGCTCCSARKHRIAADPHLYRPAWPQGIWSRICWGSRICRSSSRSSDWGGPVINEAQREYAAIGRPLSPPDEGRSSMLRLEREGRTALAQACFRLPSLRARPARSRWAGPKTDIFAHG